MWHHLGGCHAHLNEKATLSEKWIWLLPGHSYSHFHFRFHLPLLRAFKTGIEVQPSSTGLEMASRQILKCEKMSILLGKSQEKLEFEL